MDSRAAIGAIRTLTGALPEMTPFSLAVMTVMTKVLVGLVAIVNDVLLVMAMAAFRLPFITFVMVVDSTIKGGVRRWRVTVIFKVVLAYRPVKEFSLRNSV